MSSDRNPRGGLSSSGRARYNRATGSKLRPPVKGAATTAATPANTLPTVEVTAFTTFLNALPILLKNPILNKLYYDNKYRK